MSQVTDADIISKLYIEYEDKMYYEARSILHDDHLAEDAVHEAFLRLVRKGKRFDDIASDKTKCYIKKTVRSAAIDIYRQNKKHRGICSSIEEVNEAVHDEFEIYNYVLPLVDELPDKYSSVFRCIAVHGLSARETSALLGISESCARKRFERAKNLLQVKLNGKQVKTHITRKVSKR